MKILLFGAILVLTITACSEKSNKKFASAKEYDNYILSHISQMQQGLFAVQQMSGTDKGDATIKKIEAQVDSVSKQIKDMPDFNGNTSYRDAALLLAAFYQKSVTGYYADISKIYRTVKDTAMADAKVDEIITKLQEEETAADDNFMKERETFASKNKIKIEEGEEPL